MIFRRLLLCAIAGLAMASCKKSKSATEPDTGTQVNIVVTPATPSVGIGQTLALHAAVNGPPGIAQFVFWRSLDTTVVTVNTSGVLTGVATGLATVRVLWQPDTTVTTDIATQVTTGVILNGPPPSSVRSKPRQ